MKMFCFFVFFRENASEPAPKNLDRGNGGDKDGRYFSSISNAEEVGTVMLANLKSLQQDTLNSVSHRFT